MHLHTLIYCQLKLSQNKKGQKNFQLHRFLNTFSQLLAVKKYSKNGAAGKFFGSSYFDPALVMILTKAIKVILSKNLSNQLVDFDPFLVGTTAICHSKIGKLFFVFDFFSSSKSASFTKRPPKALIRTFRSFGFPT